MKNKIMLALMSSTLLLAACQSQNDVDDTENTEDTTEQTENDNQTNEEEQSTDETKGIQDTEFDISLDDAINIFHDEYGDMDVYAVELTTEDRVYQYEIKGYMEGTEYKVHIDAKNGDILDDKEKDDDDNHLNIDFDKLITPKEAMDNAIQELDEGAFITSWELGEENGKMVYEVEYDFDDANKDDGDMNVDAYSGDIVEK